MIEFKTLVAISERTKARGGVGFVQAFLRAHLYSLPVLMWVCDSPGSNLASGDTNSDKT